MKFIDFFAGIGGFRRGMELAGHECVGFCEFDKFAVASYTSMYLITDTQRETLAGIPIKQRQKEILKDEYRNGEWYSNDIRNVDAGSLPAADCWCFGAPCQDFSIAGKRAGLDGDRSSLIREIFRLLEEQEEQDRPEWLIYENVKGMLSSNRGLDYLSILSEMDRLGYDIEWQNINSKWFVPQNRERIYTVGHLRRFGRAKILPVTGTDGENSISIIGHRDGYRRNTQVFGKNGITEALDTAAGGGRGHHVGLPCFIDMNYGAGIKQTENARTSQARYNKGVNNHSGETTGVAIPLDINCININDNNGKERPQHERIYDTNGVMTALNSQLGGRHNVAIPVLTPDRAEKRQNGRRFKDNGEPMFTLTSQDKHGVGVDVVGVIGGLQAHQTIRNDNVSPTITEAMGKGGGQTPCVFLRQDIDNQTHEGIYVQLPDGVICYAIWYEKEQCYITIRKLTPKECFRLQGWTDDYFERAAFVNSDSQLYKQAGNGVTVNVIQAIAEKMGSDTN